MVITMYCKRCGAALPSEGYVCKSCGAMMSEEQIKMQKEYNSDNKFIIFRRRGIFCTWF